MKLPLKSAIAFAVLAATPVWAESGTIASPAWTWPPYIAVPLAAVLVLYAVGTVKMWCRNSPPNLGRIFLFLAGWFSLVIALDSPMHEMSEQLFWVHMTQHEILMLVTAPLLVLARPLVPLLWALPENWRSIVSSVSRSKPVRSFWLVLTAPILAWFLHALALWFWHAPALFIAALHNEAVHAAQHISFLASALLFWWALLNHHGKQLGYGAAILYVFTTAIHTSILGAWLTFSPAVWYRPYLESAPAWHLTALQDQQLGGLIMWIPAGTLLTVIGLAILIKWLSESQRRWDYSQTAAFLASVTRSSP